MAQGRTGRRDAGGDRSAHIDPRTGPPAAAVSSAGVRKVAEELAARAALLQHRARQERDRAKRLQGRSAAVAGRTGSMR